MTVRGKSQPKRNRSPYHNEPSPRDLEIYQELCKGRTIRDVGNQFKISKSQTHRIRDQVARYLAPKLAKEIGLIKASQTLSLSHIFQEMMAAWEKSKEASVETIDTVGDESTCHTVKKKSTCGDPSFAAQAMKALADIRDLWDVKHHNEQMQQGSAAIRAAGIPREVYQLKYAQAKIAEMQELVAELRENGVESDEDEEEGDVIVSHAFSQHL